MPRSCVPAKRIFAHSTLDKPNDPQIVRKRARYRNGLVKAVHVSHSPFRSQLDVSQLCSYDLTREDIEQRRIMHNVLLNDGHIQKILQTSEFLTSPVNSSRSWGIFVNGYPNSISYLATNWPKQLWRLSPDEDHTKTLPMSKNPTISSSSGLKPSVNRFNQPSATSRPFWRRKMVRSAFATTKSRGCYGPYSSSGYTVQKHEYAAARSETSVLSEKQSGLRGHSQIMGGESV